MDTPSPLRIHFGKEKPVLILFNNRQLGRLTEFKLHADANTNIVQTTFDVFGCYPDWEDPPEDGMSNQSYPLRMAFGHTTDKGCITYLGRPIGCVKEVLLHFEASGDRPQFCKKPTIRLTIYDREGHKELIDALVDLGLEIVVEPSPATLKLRVLGA
jgi:hypothetical protein